MNHIHRIVIDCDPGIDDAVALMLAAASPELQILGVTSVAGNRPLEVVGRNASRILAAAGRGEVPVYAGAARPIAHAQPRCNNVHGDDGLGGAELPDGRALEAATAAEYLARVLRATAPGSITLVAVGPLTNLALAELLHPGCLRRARALLVMGGAAFRPGNVTPAAEFNFYADPVAAHVVLGAGAPLTLFGLDVTSQAALPPEWIDTLAGLPGRCAQAVRAMLKGYRSREPRLHDACPIAWLINSGLFGGLDCHVDVDWREGPTEGKLLAWPASRIDRPGEPNAKVVTRLDGPALLRLLRERLELLP